jgi:hypothetical protein
VDAPSAAALNARLRELGLLEQPDAQRSWVVSGQVRREDGSREENAIQFKL